jgi:hypothetical protein
MKRVLLALCLFCTPIVAQETVRSSGSYSPPDSQYDPGTPAWHADMVRLGWTRVTDVAGRVSYSHVDKRNIIEPEASRPAIPFSGRSSTGLAMVGEWRSAPASSPRGDTAPDMSALLSRADQVLQTATRVANCPGGT